MVQIHDGEHMKKTKGNRKPRLSPFFLELARREAAIKEATDRAVAYSPISSTDRAAHF